MQVPIQMAILMRKEMRKLAKHVLYKQSKITKILANRKKKRKTTQKKQTKRKTETENG